VALIGAFGRPSIEPPSRRYREGLAPVLRASRGMISREGGWEAEFERLGAGEVRARLESKAYLGVSEGLAAAWLARKTEFFQAEQLALARAAASEARLANTRAQSANKIAIMAVIIAAISLITTFVLGVAGSLLK
jgi:hypothetical protein